MEFVLEHIGICLLLGCEQFVVLYVIFISVVYEHIFVLHISTSLVFECYNIIITHLRDLSTTKSLTR